MNGNHGNDVVAVAKAKPHKVKASHAGPERTADYLRAVYTDDRPGSPQFVL